MAREMSSDEPLRLTVRSSVSGSPPLRPTTSTPPYLEPAWVRADARQVATRASATAARDVATKQADLVTESTRVGDGAARLDSTRVWARPQPSRRTGTNERTRASVS